MNDLINRINNFIDKAVKFGSAKEAAQYGVKLPPSAYEKPTGPKWGGPSKTAQPKAPKQQLTGFQGRRQRRRPKRTISPEGIVGEVGAQLTPKGPYRAMSDVTQDIGESARLARKITGINKPPMPGG